MGTSQWVQRQAQQRFVYQDTFHHEVQVDCCQWPSGKEIWILDWRLHSRISGLLPANVGEQAGVRGGWQGSGGQEVSLNRRTKFCGKNEISSQSQYCTSFVPN